MVYMYMHMQLTRADAQRLLTSVRWWTAYFANRQCSEAEDWLRFGWPFRGDHALLVPLALNGSRSVAESACHELSHTRRDAIFPGSV